MIEKIIFDGNRYKITVAIDESTGYIEIYAVCKDSSRRSSITNLNFVLSKLIEPIMGETFVRKVEDSDICVQPVSKHRQLVQYIVSQLNNRLQFSFDDLEDALDEDRANGEWENFETEEGR